MNKPPQIPIETWQFFQACKTYLGSETLQKLYKISSRQIDRWCSDPDYTDSNQKNPADRIETLLSKLMALGHADIAKAAVRRYTHIVGCIMEEKQDCTPDKQILPEEMLDDYSDMQPFHQAIIEGADPLLVDKLRAELISEINETYQLYCQKSNKRK
ncbi:MAG: hypothetical protein AB7U45_10300 [Desulfamplus sp.]